MLALGARTLYEATAPGLNPVRKLLRIEEQPTAHADMREDSSAAQAADALLRASQETRRVRCRFKASTVGHGGSLKPPSDAD